MSIQNSECIPLLVSLGTTSMTTANSSGLNIDNLFIPTFKYTNNIISSDKYTWLENVEEYMAELETSTENTSVPGRTGEGML